MERRIHVVSFNVPHPANYGGVIDVFYKVRALFNLGVRIQLHCFDYGRGKSPELEKYCEKVYYYPRNKGIINLASTKPYIVKTRNNEQLLNNLQKERIPILFEGLHTTFFLKHPALADHKKIVRTHNVEHEYYEFLARTTKSSRERLFFRQEAFKLKRYEQVLNAADHLLCISPPDTNYFNQKYGKSIYMPAFHPFNEVISDCGKGEYILFHGNLEVAENMRSVNYLVNEIFTEITYPFIITGKNPPKELAERIRKMPHVKLLPNTSSEVMDKLIADSQICLIPTFQPTGLKLKLLASLFAGRHCIVNPTMVQSTGLESLCHIAYNTSEMIELVKDLFDTKFKKKDIESRKLILETQFSNEENAKKILDIL